jgi:hypothetical protein
LVATPHFFATFVILFFSLPSSANFVRQHQSKSELSQCLPAQNITTRKITDDTPKRTTPIVEPLLDLGTLVLQGQIQIESITLSKWDFVVTK